MLRTVWLSLFLSFLGHVTGAFAAVQVDACCDSCPEDGPEKHCPPTCTDCLCGAPLAVEIPAVVCAAPTWLPPSATPDELLPFTPTAPPLPDPNELLRVPR